MFEKHPFLSLKSLFSKMIDSRVWMGYRRSLFRPYCLVVQHHTFTLWLIDCHVKCLYWVSLIFYHLIYKGGGGSSKYYLSVSHEQPSFTILCIILDFLSLVIGKIHLRYWQVLLSLPFHLIINYKYSFDTKL